jgi:RimJ/RimL family protein N-acetyltransferase
MSCQLRIATLLAVPNFAEFRFEIQPHDFSCIPSLYEAIEESRESIAPWMRWMHANYSLRDTEEFTAYALTAWNERTEFAFVIRDTQDGMIVGCCGLNDLNWKDSVCNLGYWVRNSKTRLGAATETVILLKDFAFGTLGLNWIEILVADGNQPSRGVAEKVGAVHEGLQRSRVRVGERVYDAHMYALINPGIAS